MQKMNRRGFFGTVGAVITGVVFGRSVEIAPSEVEVLTNDGGSIGIGRSLSSTWDTFYQREFREALALQIEEIDRADDVIVEFQNSLFQSSQRRQEVVLDCLRSEDGITSSVYDPRSAWVCEGVG